MAERKKQFNCQPDEESWERIRELKERVAGALNLPKISDSVLLRFALIALEKEYPPPQEAEKSRRK